SLPLPPLDVRFDPRIRSALGSEQVHVRLPHDVPVPESLFDLVRHFFGRGSSIFHGLRPDLPRPCLEIFEQGRLLRALPDEGRVAKDVFLLVPIEESRHTFAPACPEWTVQTTTPTEPVPREDSLEGLLVLRVRVPRHFEAKTHAPTRTPSGVITFPEEVPGLTVTWGTDARRASTARRRSRQSQGSPRPTRQPPHRPYRAAGRRRRPKSRTGRTSH